MIMLLLVVFTAAGANAESDTMGIGVRVRDSVKTLDKLDWLVGRWTGEAFGGVCEEVWNPAVGGSMTGTFTLITDGNVAFYEFCTISIGPEGPVLRLKHFNPDLTGWEEKDEVIEFPFVSQDKNEINFEGLTYRLKSADELYIAVMLKNKDGQSEKVEINCSRAK
jgi:hypothetical protein